MSQSVRCKFLLSAVEVAQFPHSSLPEIAFVGRSNVGKSSLINTLVEADVCRVSKTPGRTQQINFFDTYLASNHLMIADLPGYGYAAVSKQMRDVWNYLIVNYLQTRKNLRRVFLLIDSRHGIKKNDEEVMELLDQICVQYQIVLTKIDKIKSKQDRIEFEQNIANIEKIIERHPAAFPEFLKTSSQNTSGLSDLYKTIISL